MLITQFFCHAMLLCGTSDLLAKAMVYNMTQFNGTVIVCKVESSLQLAQEGKFTYIHTCWTTPMDQVTQVISY